MCRLSYLVNDITEKDLSNKESVMDYLSHINLEEKILENNGSTQSITSFNNQENYKVSKQILHLNFIHLIYHLNNTIIKQNFNKNKFHSIKYLYKNFSLSMIAFEKIFLTICKYLKIISINSNNGVCNIEINTKFLNTNIDLNNSIEAESTVNKKYSCCGAHGSNNQDNTVESPDNATPPPTDPYNPHYIPDVQFINDKTTISDILDIISKAVDGNLICIDYLNENNQNSKILSFFGPLKKLVKINFIKKAIDEIIYRKQFIKSPAFKLLYHIKNSNNLNEQLAKFIGDGTTDILKDIKKEGKFTTPNKELFILFSKDEIYLINEKDNDGNNHIVSCGAANCKNNCDIGRCDQGVCNTEIGSVASYSFGGKVTLSYHGIKQIISSYVCTNCGCYEENGGGCTWG